MTRILLSVSAALVLAAGAVAEERDGFELPSVTADPGVLHRCLQSGKAVSVCLDAMTLDCMAENDIGNDNLEERLCVIEELNAWRRLLARAERAVTDLAVARTAAPHPDLPASGALAEDARRLWAGWSLAQCALERRAAQGEGRRAIVEDRCLRDLTAAQFERMNRIGEVLAAR